MNCSEQLWKWGLNNPYWVREVIGRSFLRQRFMLGSHSKMVESVERHQAGFFICLVIISYLLSIFPDDTWVPEIIQERKEPPRG